MSTLQKIKRTAAIVLLCAALLPLSECSTDSGDPRPPAPKSLSQMLFPVSHDNFFYMYAILSILSFTWAGAVTALAFTWPFILSIFYRKFPESRLWIIHSLEVLLCGGTIYWVVYVLAIGHWLYGIYVLFLAILIYGCGSLFSLIHPLRSLLIRRTALTTRST